MNVDLDKATEAAAQGIWEHRPMQRTTDGAPLPFVYAKTYEQRRCRDHAQAALAAAYPHVFSAVVEALRARAEEERRSLPTAFERNEASSAARWLARIAQEGPA